MAKHKYLLNLLLCREGGEWDHVLELAGPIRSKISSGMIAWIENACQISMIILVLIDLVLIYTELPRRRPTGSKISIDLVLAREYNRRGAHASKKCHYSTTLVGAGRN